MNIYITQALELLDRSLMFDSIYHVFIVLNICNNVNSLTGFIDAVVICHATKLFIQVVLSNCEHE